MASYPAFVFTVTSALILAYCSGENITAYIKEALTVTTCESIARIPSVCNVDWKIPQYSVKDYDESIKTINETISSSSIVFGLNSSEATKCRKAYEHMLCRDYFPVCDIKKMVINYGNGTKRCEIVKKLCKTISIRGCEHSTYGEQTIVKHEKNCVPLSTGTMKFCPKFNMKVRSGYATFAVKYIEYLSKAAENFEQETQNLTGMESCRKNFKEVLCRLVDACSPDRYYSLHLISKEECDEKMSCIKNSGGLITMDVSICNILPKAASLREFVLENPFQNKSTFSSETTVSPNGDDETGELTTLGELGPTSMSLEEEKKNSPTEVSNMTSGTLTLSEYIKCNEIHIDQNITTCSGSRNYYLVWFTFVLSIVPALLLRVT